MDLRAQRRALRVVLSTFMLAASVTTLTVPVAAASAVASNRAMAWGYNGWGLLGNGNSIHREIHQVSEEPYPLPAFVCAAGTVGECPVGPYLNGVSAVSAGYAHGLALLGSGAVMAWGENEAGQLGDGTHTGPAACAYLRGLHWENEESKPCSATPVAVSGLSTVTAIAAGARHSLALLSNGTVMAWGANDSGQLGDASTKNSDVPVAVSGLSGVTAIAAGGGHSLALLSNGTVMAWGANEWGQLGDGSTKDRHVPVAVHALSAVIAISAGGAESLAVLSDGTARSWGGNGYGLLGNGSTESEFSDMPVTVSGLSNVAAVSAGEEDSLALLSNGTVMSWGHNFIGLLGIGGDGQAEEPSYSDVPLKVCAVGTNPQLRCTSGPYLSGVKAISAAPDHDMALLETGAVVGWGQGGFGELGTGPVVFGSAFSWVPVQASGLSDVQGISAGPDYSLTFAAVAPAVTGLGPTQGLEAGGTTVNITGTNFVDGATVAFGATSASKVTVNSTSSITAVSPAGTGTVDVTVTTPEGTSATGPADRFRYIASPPPTVAKIKPNKGPVAGGTTVTITGASFTEVESVKFGSVDAASYTVNSASSITAVSPPQPAAGKINVTVTTPIATSAPSTKDYFKYLPTVIGVSPNSGSKTGGTSVTVSGSGFGLGTTATIIKFGTTKVTSVNCTSTTSCTAVSPAHAVGTVDVKASVNKMASAKTPPSDQFTYN